MSDARQSMEAIAFAERKADEMMKHHLEDMEILNREAHHTFAFAMLVLSASFSYFLKLYDTTKAPAQQDWVWMAPILVLVLQLATSATYLLAYALMTREVQTPGQLPRILIGDTAPHKDDVYEMRRAEMWSVANRAELNNQRNIATARVVNRTRWALLSAPVTFFLAWTVAQVVAA